MNEYFINNAYVISSLNVCMVNTMYLFSFVESPRKFIAKFSIRKSDFDLMKIRAYGSKALELINLRGVSAKLNN